MEAKLDHLVVDNQNEIITEELLFAHEAIPENTSFLNKENHQRTHYKTCRIE